MNTMPMLDSIFPSFGIVNEPREKLNSPAVVPDLRHSYNFLFPNSFSQTLAKILSRGNKRAI